MESWWSEPMREVFAHRDVIIAGAVPAAWNDHVAQLRAAGARSILVVATEGKGAGAGPDVPTVVTEPPDGLSMMDRLRWGLRAVSSPPPEVVEAIEEFDPSGEALAVGGFLNEAPTMVGRPVLAYRRPEWIALEDKTAADEVWDAAGVARLPSVVCDLADAADVESAVDRGAGTVWAADARDGYHGGGAGTRWVADDASRDAAMRELAPICDSVRVMPFVDGVACSIHGMVLPDGVAALRPVELVTLRRGRELVYSGCATYWDPPTEVREQMRSAAARVGDLLARRVGFRGTFTIDGVVDADGFWPTELNPRYGAGINVIATVNADLPILLLNDLIIGGRSIGRSAAELEAELVARADERRAGGTWRVGAGGVAGFERRAAYDGRTWRWVEPDEAGDGVVISAPGFARCLFEPERVPVGASVGERSAAFWNFAAGDLALEGGPVTAPPDMSRR